MKDLLNSASTYIRHGLTAVIALTLTALVSHKILPAETANSPAATEASVNLVNGLTFFLSAAVGRGVLYIASLVPFLSFLGETSTAENTSNETDRTYGFLALLIPLLCFGMMSCTVTSTTATDGTVTTTKAVDQAAVDQGVGVFEKLASYFKKDEAAAPVIVVEPSK